MQSVIRYIRFCGVMLLLSAHVILFSSFDDDCSSWDTEYTDYSNEHYDDDNDEWVYDAYFVEIVITPDDYEYDADYYGDYGSEEDEEEWGDDEEEWVNGEDYYDDYEEPEFDCAGVEGGSAYYDGCGECVGGNTGKEACKEDCAGVLGGRAYMRECNGKEYCINSNNQFNYELSDAHQEQLDSLLNEMHKNCLSQVLLEELDADYGITFKSESHGHPGSFSPCSYEINFHSNGEVKEATVVAELFHAYQEQFLEGKLRDIVEDSSHVGGANIEAEEKAMLYLWGRFTHSGFCPIGYDPIESWCEQIYQRSLLSSDSIVLTQEEIDGWFGAVEAFQEYHASQKGEGASKDLYDSPVDTKLFPTTLLDLWNKRRDCIEGGVVITGNRPSQIIKVRWR